MKEAIKRAFTYHKPQANQVPRYEMLRDEAKEFADMIDNACPDSEEKDTALVKLQEAVMWANAAIARNE